MVDRIAIGLKAKAFAAEHASAIAAEQNIWQDTALLPNGKLRELCEIITPMDPHNDMQIAEHFAQRAIRDALLRTGLHPEMGFILDGANEGELAAYDYAVQHHCIAVTNILDGKVTDGGNCNDPWGSVRERLVELVKRTKGLPNAD
jgi:hypothetical protein